MKKLLIAILMLITTTACNSDLAVIQLGHDAALIGSEGPTVDKMVGPRGHVASPEVATAIRKYFGDNPPLLQQAIRVADCESEFKKAALRTFNPGQQKTGDFGLYGINYIHKDRLRLEFDWFSEMVDLFDPMRNAEVARFIYNTEGWGPWYMSEKCHSIK